VEVYDRPAVILEIFHRHARTKEAQLQVELARLKYLAPRERVSRAKERKGGGRGGRGVSESFHEIERREVRDRISELQQELKAVHREQVERRRHREGLPKAAIVGYTNAGKSSLMRALTSSEVLVADQLFATLDTTVRALQPETQPRILVSDTVGFIRNLPHDLVASFRSTLDEALDASLLLHVVDAADPALRSLIQVTKEGDCSRCENTVGFIDLGFRLAQPFWGQGLATEASCAWVRAAFDDFHIDRLTAFVHPENVASRHDTETQFEQFAVNARCSPGRILGNHAKDQGTNLFADTLPPSHLSDSGDPCPIQTKPRAMPVHDGSGSDQNERLLPPGPERS
jgi:hypothetical protein